MKLGLLAASLVLVAGAAAGCGGDSDSDGDRGADGGGDSGASIEDFCGAFQDFYDDLTSVTGTEENLGEILKDAASQIEDAGTPDDIPDDAKEGLEIVLDQIDALPDDASAEDISGLNESLSEDEQAKSDAFTEYLNKTCPDIGGGDEGTTPDDPASDADRAREQRVRLRPEPTPVTARGRRRTGSGGGHGCRLLRRRRRRCADGGSVEDFCAALEQFQGSVDAADSTDLAAYIRALKDAAAEVSSVGVPDDMPNAARRGFELTVQRIEDLPDGATQEDVAALGDVDDADQRRLDALEDYIENACPDIGVLAAVRRLRRPAAAGRTRSPSARPAASQSSIPPSRLTTSRPCWASQHDRLRRAAADLADHQGLAVRHLVEPLGQLAERDVHRALDVAVRPTRRARARRAPRAPRAAGRARR